MQDPHMKKYFDSNFRLILKAAADAELDHVRRLGSSENLIMATANLGAYEALLIILAAGESGVPVYQAVTGVRSRFSSQAGVINRVRAMRAVGLLEERSGSKRSQVCLVPSEQLIREIAPILLARHDAEA